MTEKELIIEGHNTTLHDGGIAILSAETPNLWALSAERISRVKHDGNSNVAYKYMRDRLTPERYKFGGSKDRFNPTYEEYQELHHHMAHAAGAFYPSGFEEAAILVIDGQGGYLNEGDCASTSIWKGEGKSIDLLEINDEEDIARQSLGHFYSSITYYLGFGFLQEGKTMGLASYGEPSEFVDFLDKYIQCSDDGSYHIHPRFIRAMLYLTEGRKIFKLEDYTPSAKTLEVVDDIYNTLGPPRKKKQPLTRRDMDLAWASQDLLENAVLGLADRAKRLTSSDRLCYSGGVALNSVTNSKILSSGIFKDVFILPPAGDDGQALGRLLYRTHNEYNLSNRYVMNDAYLGPEYSSEEIKDAIGRFEDKIIYEKLLDEDLFLNTAQRLTDGEVFGWWQGRSELGPRALGNRSILADPRIPGMKDYINARVKYREQFRPLAPSVLLEDAHDFFDLQRPEPYMLHVASVHKEQQNKIPSVVHVDGSSRPQTVTEEENERYYNLILSFGKMTGVPVLLNTSFNTAGEPIVETPMDAINSFLKMNLDGLVLGDYIIDKK